MIQSAAVRFGVLDLRLVECLLVVYGRRMLWAVADIWRGANTLRA